MRIALLVCLFTACITPQVAAPIAKPIRNLAESYVLAVDPSAVCMRWGQTDDGTDDAVFCRAKSILFYCATSASRRTRCQELVDLEPKAAAPPQPSPPAAPPPASPPPPKKPAK